MREQRHATTVRIVVAAEQSYQALEVCLNNSLWAVV